MFMAKSSIGKNDTRYLHLALILAWLIPGAGHWYMGHRGRAVAILLVPAGRRDGPAGRGPVVGAIHRGTT